MITIFETILIPVYRNKITEMFLKLLLITSVLLIISFAGLAISMLIKKNGSLP